MNPNQQGTRARVLAAALHHWSAIDTDPTPAAARIQIRQPPTWAYAGTITIGQRQHQRLLAFLRDDLAEHHPGHSTPERAAAVIRALIAELAAAGHTRLTPADLTAAAPRIGRDRAWIAAHISHLIDTGHLHETRRPGTFRIPTDQPTATWSTT